ncbi:MAG: 50S ribosomal protein L21 [Myxococcota bacterium]
MYAVVRADGKQHRVSQGERFTINMLLGEVGGTVKLDDVLMVGGEGEAKIGVPTIAGASVTAKVVAQGRGSKVLVYKKRRRKGFDKLIGHRQDFTELEITGISA